MLVDLLRKFVEQMGFISKDANGNFDYVSLILRLIMIIIAFVLIFLAIKKHFEPYLLIPIGVGMLLVNLAPSLMSDGTNGMSAGLLYNIHKGIDWGLFPPLIFLGIGATTDFGPLISRPSSFLLGAAAQIGIFLTFLGALLLGFNSLQAASIGIIGGVDGPTAIYLSSKLLQGSDGGSMLMASIAVVAYSYMALIPIIQPPIIKLLTTKKERQIVMSDEREISKKERILFPLVIMTVVIILIPSCAPLIGMLMLGNIIKESGVVPNLVEASAKTLLYVVTIFLGLAVGSSAILSGFNEALDFLKILGLGLVAFVVATIFGVLFGKLMSKISKGRINPMIGAAGVSAVPMAARVVHKLGQEENSDNYLLMHAMGPNVAGVIGSAVAAGLLLSFLG